MTVVEHIHGWIYVISDERAAFLRRVAEERGAYAEAFARGVLGLDERGEAA